MNATFPIRKSFILQGAILAGVFLLVLSVLAVVPLLPLNLSHHDWVPIAVAMWGPQNAIWVGMFLLSLWILLAGIRVKVIIQGSHVADVGVFRRKEFSLSEVTAARWEFRGRSRRPRLMVCAAAGWIPFDFRVHRNTDARQLLQYFREGLAPEVQEGWTPEWQELHRP